MKSPSKKVLVKWMLAKRNPQPKKILLAAVEMPTMPNEQNKTIYEVFEKAKKAKSTLRSLVQSFNTFEKGK